MSPRTRFIVFVIVVPIISIVGLGMGLLEFAYEYGTGQLNPRWRHGFVTESEARGDSLVGALKRYNADHGHFPKSLNDLVPKYIQQVRPPVAGNKKWDYWTSGEKFSLRFADDDPLLPEYYIEDRDYEWHESDKY